jgi:hypothetical protein
MKNERAKEQRKAAQKQRTPVQFQIRTTKEGTDLFDPFLFSNFQVLYHPY